MVNNEKERPRWPLQRLKSMYFAMYCWKCKKFELPEDEFEETEYQHKCEKNIQKTINNMRIKEMKFKHFKDIIKNSLFCKFEKRNFNNNCPICRRFGISNHR
jgi:hypothetical protein